MVVFLETAELRAKNRQEITITFWHENVVRILEFNDKLLLSHKGTVSHAEMEQRVEALYVQYDTHRKQIEAAQADEQDLAELNAVEKRLQVRTPKKK